MVYHCTESLKLSKLERNTRTLRENQMSEAEEKLNQPRALLAEEASVIINEISKGLHSAQQKINTLEKENAILQDRVEDLVKTNNELTRMVNDLVTEINAVFRSLTWKIGNGFAILYRAVTGKINQPIARDNLQHIKRRYDLLLDKSKTERDQAKGQGQSTGAATVMTDYPVVNFDLSIDIVICVHNALGDVIHCLDSIRSNTSLDYKLVIVNDGSDKETSDFLNGYSKQHQVRLLENEIARGYTKAVNQALRLCDGDYVVLLNSDTVVPNQWLQGLIECGESDPRIGAVGALSNAASWQSVPDLYAGGDWAVNELPMGFGVTEMNELVYLVSEKSFPRVPFVNGFCFMLKRAAILAVGQFDEERFPFGYGEENDYCMRLKAAGFELAIADHVYIYHAKSKSYTHTRRTELSKQGSEALKDKHGSELVKQRIEEIKLSSDLALVRENVRRALKGDRSFTSQGVSTKILFVLPAGGVSGGVNSILQEVRGMRDFGVPAVVMIPIKYSKKYKKNYRDFFDDPALIQFYHDNDELEMVATSFEMLVATTWNSVEVIQPILKKNPFILGAYYIQDYEPLFFEPHTSHWEAAIASYELIPKILAFAKTDWICRTVETRHQIKVFKVMPSLDKDVFYAGKGSEHGIISICAMIRPASPRRGASRTMHVLKEIRNLYGEKVKISIFGSEETDLSNLESDFEFESHGILTRKTVADLLRQSSIFVDFSYYQAFGRTGLEAMACGCAVILPVVGGALEYAINGENSLVVDTLSNDEMLNGLKLLIDDHELRCRLRENGLRTASTYSIQRASLSELSLFRSALWKARHSKDGDSSTRKNEVRKDIGAHHKDFLRISALLTTRLDGHATGSAHIRVLRPLLHESLSSRLKLTVCDEENLFTTQSDIILIQRDAIRNIDYLNRLMKHSRTSGIKLVCEIDDDLLGLDQSKSYDKERMSALANLLSKVDSIVTTTQKLKSKLEKYNRNVDCVENALDEGLWITKYQAQYVCPHNVKVDDQIRILYMGTKTHQKDLAVIGEALAKIRRQYGDRVVLEVIGGIPTGFQAFNLPVNCRTLVPSSELYPDFIRWLRKHNHWDFGVIPLDTNEFNRCKSYIKFLDYSALGIPSICSSIDPYEQLVGDGKNGLLVQNTTEMWYGAIQTLIEEPVLRRKLASQAFHDLISHHILASKSEAFYKAYKTILQYK